MSGEVTAVAARDESQKNSPIAGGSEEDVTVVADDDAKCYWNGDEFGDGARVCAEGVPHECHYGQWMKMPGGC